MHLAHFMLFVSLFFFSFFFIHSVVTLYSMPMREREYQRTIRSYFSVEEALLSNDIEYQKQGDAMERKKNHRHTHTLNVD
jgi:hypothetical protein